MQTQADAAGANILVSEEKELSPVGAGYLAGISAGVFSADVLKNLDHKRYSAQNDKRDARARFQKAIACC